MTIEQTNYEKAAWKPCKHIVDRGNLPDGTPYIEAKLPCDTCQGTGLRFPDLTEPCPDIGLFGWDVHRKVCRMCQGGRILLAPHNQLEPITEELISLSGEALIGKIGNGPRMEHGHTGYYVIIGDDPPVISKGVTKVEAAAVALLQYVEVQ